LLIKLNKCVLTLSPSTPLTGRRDVMDREEALNAAGVK
jgi:hypothetical protein